MWYPSCYSCYKQMMYIYNDNELHLCHECQNKNINVTIKLQYMYHFIKKNANYNKEEIVKYFECYIWAI
jgi:hypothetical protein